MPTAYADELSDGRGASVLLKILRKIFEEIVEFCVRTKGDIPISFLLGFFVSGIISRWYQMYLYIPWMNQIALQIASCINGKSEDGSRKIRLTIMRYMNLAWVLMMKRISDQIACRFIKNDDIGSVPSVLGPILPKRKSTNHKHLISRNTCQPWSIDASEVVRTTPSKSILQQQISQTQYTSPIKLDSPFNSIYAQPQTPNSSDVHTPLAPLATDEECGALPDAFEAADVVELRETFRAFNQDQKTEISSFERIAADWFRRTKTNYTPEYWIPIQWAQRLTLKALESGYITDPKNIGRVRQKMQDLQVYSSIMIPLVYTQVVIIAVYSYFMCQIFACQFVDHRNEDGQHKVDLYVPIFSIFSFLFLMGWLKVALCVMNPFGDDDEDFQTSKILDYNLDVSYRSVFMDNDAFPENLTAPLGKKRTDETEIDELENVSNLEMHPSFCERARNLCCCEKKKSPTPPVIVTNADYAKLNSLFKLQEPNFKSLYTTTQHTEFI
ncbi:Bestrophin-1 [Schistosoma japonicum]|nr:Bestrophin-1 [Schistosoma japonicum]